MNKDAWAIATMYFVALVIVVGVSFISILGKLDDLKQRKDVHWMLPPNAECAVKMMILRDKDNNKMEPVSRMVCHWDNKK